MKVKFNVNSGILLNFKYNVFLFTIKLNGNDSLNGNCNTFLNILLLKTVYFKIFRFLIGN